MSAPAAPSPVRRWLGRLGAVLGCLLVISLAAVWSFPWERLAQRYTGDLQRLIGAEVRIASLGPGLTWTGPWMMLRDVVLQWPDASLTLDEARLRPALALSWLRAEPAVALQLESSAGAIRGTLWPGEMPAFAGRVDDLDPVALPPRLLGGQFPPVTGLIDATLSVAMGGRASLTGSIELEAREGTVVIPDFPMAIPFDVLRGDVEVGEDGATSLQDVALEGPLVNLEGAGTVGAAQATDRAPLDLTIVVGEIDPAIGGLLGGVGVTGGASYHIGGTLGNPRVQQR